MRVGEGAHQLCFVVVVWGEGLVFLGSGGMGK